MVPNDGNPWDGILVSTIFALCATVHATTQHTPAQLVRRYNIERTSQNELAVK